MTSIWTQLDFPTEPISPVAKLVADDIDYVYQNAVPTQLIDTPDGGSSYLVDYENLRFQNQDVWKDFELTFWTVKETEQHLINHLKEAAKELGSSAHLQEALLRGSVSSLRMFAARLRKEGRGRLAALAIKEIMDDVALATVRSVLKELHVAAWAFRVLQDCWKSLMTGCVRAVFGPSFRRACRRARLLQVLSFVPFLRVSG